MRVILVVILLINVFTINGQVTSDDKYMQVAREQFCLRIEKKTQFDKQEYIYMAINDTINIKYIFPIYYLDSIDKMCILKNMINYEQNPLNQIFIVENSKCVWTGKIAKGISSKRKEINLIYPYKKWINSSNCYLMERFYVMGITMYSDFKKILERKSTWSFFIIFDFDGIWAIDEKQQIRHIYQKWNKLIIEDGQLYFEKYVKKNGIECIMKIIDGYICK